MFLPGVAADPAFTHLAFSAAFALFAFAEYVRYFALYPFGAAVHLFMNEFLDHKDSGTAILSHFYLLTGCAGSLWFEGPSRLLLYTGILAVGVGDAMASIVGKRLGRHKWSMTTSKTVEGSAAFTLSVVAFGWLLRLCGLTGDFSLLKYALIVGLSHLMDSEDHPPSGAPLSFPVPSLALSDVSIPLSLTAQQNSVSIVPHVQIATAKRGTRSLRSLRPSTASAVEEKAFLLPSIPNSYSASEGGTPLTSPRSENDSIAESRRETPESHQGGVLQPSVTENTLSSSAPGWREAVPRRPDISVLRSPFDPTLPLDSSSISEYSLLQRITEAATNDHDWATFVSAYALGGWDPHKTPNQPRSCFETTLPSGPFTNAEASLAPIEFVRADGSTLPGASARRSGPTDLTNLLADADTGLALQSSYTRPITHQPPSQISSPITIPSSARTSGLSRRPTVPLSSSPNSRRLRNPFPEIRSSAGVQSPAMSLGSLPTAPHADITTTAATMRWAAARVNISPLALPSPEHELTDPMRGAIAVIPGSYAAEAPAALGPQSPGVRKPRLGSFWEGTQDVDIGRPLTAIHTSSSSASSTVNQSPDELTAASSVASSLSLMSATAAGPPVPPATAPVQHSTEQLDDYFGNAVPSQGLSHSRSSSGQRASTHSDKSPVPQQQTPTPPFDAVVQTVPAAARRVCLTRQTSSPLPNSQGAYDARLGHPRAASDAGVSLKAGRAVKEESMFLELGYLTAPHPPDELDRRRALHQFNIRNTGPDVNFDRIERLTKLVFSTKIVAISLIDGVEQWFKAESGLGFETFPRTGSICAHAILQR
ncbi:hypothetical protein EW146_g1411, partial [Bondarzewia mesenterica]